MNMTTKIAIVVGLVVAVAGAVALKQAKRPGGSAASTASIPAKPLPRLVDLGADKCIPCKMMKPILDDLKTNYASHFITEFIDVWENPDEGKKHGIEMIPTQIFYDAEGEELFRHTGFYAKEDILAKWKDLGVDIRSSVTATN